MQLSPINKLESPSQILRQPVRLQFTEKKPSGRFTFLKKVEQNEQVTAQNNRDRIKQNFKGSMQLIINKPTQVSKDLLEELKELGRKLDIEFDEYDLEFIIPNTTQFEEEYDVFEYLGEGCLGIVKRIVNKTTQIEYAVKSVQTQDDEIIRNMIIEFKSMVKLQHKNIVKMNKLYVNFDNRFQSESQAHVVMELVKGREMFEVLNSLGHYSEADAKELFKQLLSAIEYLHRQGICHRDLKPNNILCLEDQKLIKITDFNVSKFSESYKEFGDLKDREKIEMWTYTGTVAFSAPEIFTGEGYNQMVDMWSAGCILYSMLSGQLPFNEEYLNDLIEKIKEAKFEFPSETFCEVSEEAKDLIKQLLQKDWSLRPHPDSALKHKWFQEEDTLDGTSKSLLKNLRIKKNNPNLTSKFSKNSERQKSILLGSSQLLINHLSMELKCNTQLEQTFQLSNNLCSMKLDQSSNKKSRFHFYASQVPDNEIGIYQYLPPPSPENEQETDNFIDKFSDEMGASEQLGQIDLFGGKLGKLVNYAMKVNSNE